MSSQSAITSFGFAPVRSNATAGRSEKIERARDVMAAQSAVFLDGILAIDHQKLENEMLKKQNTDLAKEVTRYKRKHRDEMEECDRLVEELASEKKKSAELEEIADRLASEYAKILETNNVERRAIAD